MSKHAVLSPSSAVRWMNCPGSVRLAPDSGKSSRASAEGSVAHEIAAACLEQQLDASAWVGSELSHDGFTFEITQEMADDIQRYVDEARQAISAHTFLVEQRVPIGHITGEEGAEGTADLIIFRDDEIEIRDLKFGRGVEVEATENPQLIMYALGALKKFEPMLGDIKHVRCTIHQPRLAGPKEEVYTLDELDFYTADISRAARATYEPDAPLNPTNDGCKFCPAKATCPKLREETLKTVGEDFDDLSQCSVDTLADDLSRVERVEAWCKAVRAEVERRLINGIPVPGWKLIAGRRSPKAWVDESVAIKHLEALIGPDAWERSLISPTKAAKMGVSLEMEGPDGDPVVLFKQNEGKPSVAPETHKSPAISVAPTTDDFDNLNEAPE
jgi:hypothetical protein